LLFITDRNSQLWATPNPPFPRTFPPQTLLIGTLLSTTFTVLLFTLIRTKPFTKHFLLIGLLASSLGGAIFAVDVPDFMFRYVFVGTNLALIGSAFFHRFHRNDQEEKTTRSGSRSDVEEVKEKVEMLW
jgi:hypothetical protein